MHTKRVESNVLIVILLAWSSFTLSSKVCAQHIGSQLIPIANWKLPQESFVPEFAKYHTDDRGTTYLYIPSSSTERQSEVKLGTYSNTGANSIEFKLPDTVTCSSRFPLLDFEINGNLAALVFECQYLLIYRHIGDEWTLATSALLDHVYTRVHLLDSVCVLTLADFRANADINKAWVARFDVGSNKMIREVQVQVPDGEEFTMFVPRSTVSFGRSLVAITDLARYHVNFYDYHFNLIDSLSYAPNDWIPRAPDHETFKPEHSGKWYAGLRLDEYRSSLIKRVDLLNDTTLLVSRNTGKLWSDGYLKSKRIVKYDIWKHRSRWELTNADLVDSNPSLSDSLTVPAELPLPSDYRCDGHQLTFITQCDLSTMHRITAARLHNMQEFTEMGGKASYWLVRRRFNVE